MAFPTFTLFNIGLIKVKIVNIKALVYVTGSPVIDSEEQSLYQAGLQDQLIVSPPTGIVNHS